MRQSDLRALRYHSIAIATASSSISIGRVRAKKPHEIGAVLQVDDPASGNVDFVKNHSLGACMLRRASGVAVFAIRL